jgi:hypothetical protein
MKSEVYRDGRLKVTASNHIISSLDVPNNKQYSANGIIFILGTLDKMYLRKLITYKFDCRIRSRMMLQTPRSQSGQS